MEARPRKHDLVLCLVGSQGSGKSATGNTIIGEKVFTASTGTRQLTTKLDSKEIKIETINVLLYDTPCIENIGLDTINRKIKQNTKCPKVYAIIIRIGRFTPDEKIILEKMFKSETDLLKNPIMIFTNKKELYSNEITFNHWLDLEPDLKNLIKRHSVDYCIFENSKIPEQDNVKQINDLALLLEKRQHQLKSITPNKEITVGREKMGNEFGNRGLSFFDEQFSLQNRGGTFKE